jgi:transposase-like protein
MHRYVCQPAGIHPHQPVHNPCNLSCPEIGLQYFQIMIEKKRRANKHQLITEYLTSDQTFESLGAKHGVPGRTIQTWVRSYRKSHPEIFPVLAKGDEKELKKQLEQEKLKNDLLEEMLRLAEEHTGIDLRKKFGAKQS